MVVNTKALLDGVAILADDRNLRATVQHSSKGALVCGASCFIGGLLLGPVGLAVGGTLGGLKAWQMSKDQFKPVSAVIRFDLTALQREMLYEKIMEVVGGLEVTDVGVLLPLLMGNASVQTAVLKTVVSFVTNEMKMQILD